MSHQLNEREAKVRIKKLRETIDHHRYLYHVLDRQEISDSALDSLKHELYQLEQMFPKLITQDSPTQRVGGAVLAHFEKVRHRSPMLSMEDIFSYDELTQWRERLTRVARAVEGAGYYAEIKMDGLAVSLRYENGLFMQGTTRGDGGIGEDVTQNLKTIESIPLQLRIPTDKEIQHFQKAFHPNVKADIMRKRLKNMSDVIEIRGEVFMSKKTFEHLNQQQKKKGNHEFANPRNAAAGSIRQLDSSIAAQRQLDFFGYALMDEESFGLTTHEQGHELMKLLGIKVNTLNHYCDTLKEVERYHSKIYQLRTTLPYWTDGVVVVINESTLFYKLGVAGKAPRGMIAYKFAAQQVTTVIESVNFQVGRTGALTPVATLRPVAVGGTTVSHATLHNIDEIARLDARIGDTVIIEKAGDIIPKVMSVVKDMRNGKEGKIITPQHCPICESPIMRKKGEIAVYCSNKNCFAQEKERIIHFVSKKGFDIDGLGEKIVEHLIGAGLVRSAADLFALTRDDLEPLERFAAKSSQNLIEALQKSKTIEFHKFIYALGIRHVGDQTSIDLAKNFTSIHALAKTPLDELEKIPNIGVVVAQSIHDYFSQEKNRALIKELLGAGVRVLHASSARVQSLSGKVFVLTGELDILSRDEAKTRIRELGGVVSSSVSSNTDYVVVGGEPGSKYDKARKLNVTIIDEKKFLALLAI